MYATQYELTKDLLKEARRIAKAYLGQQTIEIMGDMDICLAMARNSFVAHSLCGGHDRLLVERIAEHVFHPVKYFDTTLN